MLFNEKSLRSEDDSFPVVKETKPLAPDRQSESRSKEPKEAELKSHATASKVRWESEFTGGGESRPVYRRQEAVTGGSQSPRAHWASTPDEEAGAGAAEGREGGLRAGTVAHHRP